MPKLQGSCHCGAVRFSVQSQTPQPYMHCYCSICRKTAGGQGGAINIMGEADSLVVEGEEHLNVYNAVIASGESEERSPAERNFCRHCGSALFVRDPRWPQWVYPFASAIDSALPRPPERVHIMLGSKASWVEVPEGEHEHHFEAYPELSIEEWHRRHGLFED